MAEIESVALSPEDKLQIVSMYSSSAFSILAVTAEPGWNVVGTLPLDVTAKARLDLIGCVSDPSLTLTARLYCVSPGFAGEVSGTRVAITGATIDTRVLSSFATLTGGRLYQVQAQVVGNAGDNYFGIVRRAAPAGA